MGISDQVLLLLSALGGINGLLLAGFLLASPSSKLSERFLAGVVLMLSIRILKSVLFFFNPDIARSILQVGLSACFMIGPFLYCYALSLQGRIKLGRRAYFHLLLPLTVIVVAGSVWPYHSNPSLWGNVFYKVINYVWLAYIVLTTHLVWPELRRFSWQSLRASRHDAMLLSMLVGNAIIWCAYFFASYTSYIVGACSFSFVFYLAILTVVQQKNSIRHSGEDPNTIAKTVAKKGVHKYANTKFSQPEASAMQQQLATFMADEQVFLDANLTLPKLAKRLGWSTPKLSQLLNDNLAKSFSDYINGLRIEYAKRLMDEGRKLKMDSLAEQSGYNSLSTFYAAFKKHTQLTPAKYKALQANNHSGIIN